jgi:transcriptional regulator with XRE-family HTH domain
MLIPLGRVAREARLEAERTQLDIAVRAGTNHATISRFELGRSWPLDPDRVVAAYERECGLKTDELWRRAILR